MKRQDFMRMLEERIETATANLIREGKMALGEA
jgi:hypothetical protein